MDNNIFKYNDGGRSGAGYKGDAGDCVCRAICIVTGKPYDEVYNFLANGNKQQRLSKFHKNKIKLAGKHGGEYLEKKFRQKTAANGIYVKRKWFIDYMNKLGFTWHPTMFVGNGCKVHLQADELPTGRLIVVVSKHYTTVIDGVINDTHNPQRGGGSWIKVENGIETRGITAQRCVYGYWKLN